MKMKDIAEQYYDAEKQFANVQTNFYTQSHKRICQHDADFIVFWGKESVATVEKEENAALVAAAPELLEALEAIDAALVSCPDYGAFQTVNGVTFQPFGLVRAAIAKAKGVQS
jgi:hypothetical protein